MIIFGISSSERQGDALPDRCPHCEETTLVSARRFRYFHLFWLPVIPLGSAKSITCSHCKLALDVDEVEAPTRERAVAGTQDIGRPRWHFIGTTLIAGIIGFNIYDGAQLDAHAEQAAAEPRVGDVWIVDVENTWEDAGYPYRYSVGRVSDVDGDQVALAMSDWSYAFPSGARKEGREAIKEKKEDYFVNEVRVSVPQMVAFEATEEFRLLR